MLCLKPPTAALLATRGAGQGSFIAIDFAAGQHPKPAAAFAHQQQLLLGIDQAGRGNE